MDKIKLRWASSSGRDNSDQKFYDRHPCKLCTLHLELELDNNPLPLSGGGVNVCHDDTNKIEECHEWLEISDGDCAAGVVSLSGWQNFQ